MAAKSLRPTDPILTRMLSPFSSMKLFIFPLLIATISSNFFVLSDEFSQFCEVLSKSLTSQIMKGSITTNLPFTNIKIYVASSEKFAGGMYDKMENFAETLATFVENSKNHRDRFPENENKFTLILNEDAILAFKNEFISSTRDTTGAKELEALFSANAEPGQLANIFTLLDNLIVNIKEVRSANEQGLVEPKYMIFLPGREEAKKTGPPPTVPLAKYIAHFLEKVKTFVHHLKREIIYAQSEATISNLTTEFHEFTKNVITPIKEEASKYAKNEFKKSLKEEVKKYGKKIQKNSGSMQPAMIAKVLYNEDYQKNLEQRAEESSSMENNKPSKGNNFVEKVTLKARTLKDKMSSIATSSKGKKGKGPEHSALLSNAEQQREDTSISEQAKFFDQLEAEYMVKSRKDKDKNFLVQCHQYQYLYGLLKSSSNELYHKIKDLVTELSENGSAKMANKIGEEKKKYDNDKQVIYVLAENIVKPLLNVIDGQMRQEYGPRIAEKADYKTIEKYFREKSAITMEMMQNWVISKEMINAEMAMIASNSNKTKAIRQFRIRLAALKLLVIYERLGFFFKIFENEKNMAPDERQQMANDWLNGNLDGQKEKFILPERFGQLIFEETKKRMEEGKKQIGNIFG